MRREVTRMGRNKADQGPEALTAVLHCPECGDDVPHRVTYTLGTVVETVCIRCERTLLTRRRRRASGSKASPRRANDGSAHRSLLSVLPISPRRVGLMAVSLPVRALTKPGRLWLEMRREGAGVLLSVPRRAATKPVRLAAELVGLDRTAR